MDFIAGAYASTLRIWPFIAVMQVMLIPFIILEQALPAGSRPRFGDYLLNILIALTTPLLVSPLGALAGAGGATLREQIGFAPLGFSFEILRGVSPFGGALEAVAVIIATLLLHDLWFYWAHRIEHKVPFLWRFHQLHHSDERMNASTWARDHFLQTAWRAVFPAFTFGLVLQLTVPSARDLGAIVALLPSLLSMFYHSGVRLRLAWLNRILVTPQVHRIHHSTDPKHYNKNFADFLPVMDIIFGTFYAPAKDEFPETGLGPDYKAPRNIFAAQLDPVVAAFRTLMPKRRAPKAEPNSAV